MSRITAIQELASGIADRVRRGRLGPQVRVRAESDSAFRVFVDGLDIGVLVVEPCPPPLPRAFGGRPGLHREWCDWAERFFDALWDFAIEKHGDYEFDSAFHRAFA